MLTLIIGILFLVVVIPSAANGQWGSVAVAVVILLFLMACSSEERNDAKAYMNFRDYWAEGGPERKRR